MGVSFADGTKHEDILKVIDSDTLEISILIDVTLHVVDSVCCP